MRTGDAEKKNLRLLKAKKELFRIVILFCLRCCIVGLYEEECERDAAKEDLRLRQREEELVKISSGIGNVFLQTIRQTERIKNAKLQNIDPRLYFCINL